MYTLTILINKDCTTLTTVLCFKKKNDTIVFKMPEHDWCAISAAT